METLKMTEKIKLSVAEIADLADKAKKKGINSGLPATRAGVNRRVTKQGWESEDIPTAGGKNGFKKLYTIPSYIIEELKEKGVLDLLTPGKEGSSSTQSGKYPAGSVGALTSALKEPIYKEYGVVKREKTNLPVVPLSMQQMVKEYADWSEKQDTAEIVPVRYHTSVFASAGAGSIVWDVETEAMWFRASFFQYLGIPPERCFCTRIKGDSMFPTIIDRGTVLWQACAEFVNEGIYLFRQGNELKVKRLQKIAPSVFRVISDNPNKGLYPTFDLDLSHSEDHYFEIYGCYLWDCGISN